MITAGTYTLNQFKKWAIIQEITRIIIELYYQISFRNMKFILLFK